eukprot:TRINITY_DN67119_c0_g1_i1.p1 TRINITY_DN67119_c0_g1~~TRINITY_DN67119_c0_g1_i1.p1  ORF type:complete len:444 (-),score=54.69 TRINITY_DN67119_c0_g1_i1:570-1901(-)
MTFSLAHVGKLAKYRGRSAGEVELIGDTTQQGIIELLPWSTERYEALVQSAHDGTLAAPLRGLVWRVFLGLLPAECDSDIWLKATSSARRHYEKLVAKHPSPEYEDPSSPCWDDADAVALDESIKKDLDRLHLNGLDDDFFTVDSRRRVLHRVLYVWAACHPASSYRQGMHEVLAALVLVLERDVDRIALGEIELGSSDLSVLSVLASLEYIEADAFAIFERLMKHLELWYSGVDCVHACEHVQGDLLGHADPHLAQVLEDFNILPQLYGMRWLRLMFLREFDLESVFMIWDWVFASAAAPLSVNRGLGTDDGTDRGAPICRSLETFSVSLLRSLVDLTDDPDSLAVTRMLMHGTSPSTAAELITQSNSFTCSQPPTLSALRISKRQRVRNTVVETIRLSSVVVGIMVRPLTSRGSAGSTRFDENKQRRSPSIGCPSLRGRGA